MINKIRLMTTLLWVICITILFLINLIPRGNFLSAPVISLFIYFPLIVVQFLILINVWFNKNISKKSIKIYFFLNLIICLIFIFLFVNFLITTS